MTHDFEVTVKWERGGEPREVTYGITARDTLSAGAEALNTVRRHNLMEFPYEDEDTVVSIVKVAS